MISSSYESKDSLSNLKSIFNKSSPFLFKWLEGQLQFKIFVDNSMMKSVGVIFKRDWLEKQVIAKMNDNDFIEKNIDITASLQWCFNFLLNLISKIIIQAIIQVQESSYPYRTPSVFSILILQYHPNTTKLIMQLPLQSDFNVNHQIIFDMFFWICIAISLWTIDSIRFGYILPRHQIQCFHETVERDARYQIFINANSSQYYLHVVDKTPVHEDTRNQDAQQKQFAAYAIGDDILTFCVGNLGNNLIQFDIQFYHGLYLEEGIESIETGKQLNDLADRWQQQLTLIEHNYQIYRKQVFNRRQSSARITTEITKMVFIIVFTAAIFKFLFFRKTISFLKEKKLV